MTGFSKQKPLNDCACCEGQSASTPQRIENRSGLSTIAYRTGDYHSFKQSMLAALSSSERPELQGLKTREDNDFSIALVDAWATVSEILCFYQEYFANEGLLRTAKERLSILEHARLVGYQLHPGVAASSYAAFTMEEPVSGFDNPVLETKIAAGVKIQSTPGPDETAQLYETEKEITARVDWNLIRPRMTQPQLINASMQSVVINGSTTFVKPGDNLLLIDKSNVKHIRKVTDIVVDDTSQTTQLKISGNEVSPDQYSIEPRGSDGAFSHFDGKLTVDNEVIDIFITYSWSMEDIIAITNTKHWNIDEIMQRINTHTDIVENISDGVAVYGFHKRANLFGYNAQKRVTYTYGTPKDILLWDEWPAKENLTEIYLDTMQSEVVAGSFLIFHTPQINIPEENTTSENYGAAKIEEVVALSRTEYGISSKTTQLKLLDQDVFVGSDTIDMQIIRGSTLQVQSEALELIQVPIDEKISGDSILLERADLYLRKQQYVSVSGEPCDQAGTVVNEVLQIDELRLEHGFTQLIFVTALKHEYKRDTVSINANVSLVSHGESVSEILGSGDAGISSQAFSLKQIPLTYISADTVTGVSSTLEIRVNNVLWHQVETFLGIKPDEKVYTIKLNDDGITHIYFGDGIEGARLPSGNNNIIAYYRKGLGLGGLIKSKQLNLLLTRPLGVKDAINPLPSSGADDPEKLENARSNAPLGLLTMDRAVSLQDYEDYSRSFAGIRKAMAMAVSQQGVPTIFISLAGPDGVLIEPLSKTYKNLLSALKNSGDPYTQFSLLSYRPAYFKLDAELYIHTDYVADLVLDSAQLALREKFSFEARSFNQAVHLSEVINTLQQVEGVSAVDLNYLYRSDTSPISPPLRSLMPNISSANGQILAAELLMLDPAPLDHIKVKS